MASYKSFILAFFIALSFSSIDVGLAARAVKRASPNGFGLVLTGFGLNGPGQKSPGLNGPGKLRT